MKLSSRYKTIGPIGEGGMSEVFLADDTYLERKVAVKKLKKGYDPKFLEKEIKALLNIRSKHVVQIYEILSLEDGSKAVIQEFIDGHHLSDQIPDDQILKTFYQLSMAICEIHEHDIIHRDIKPDNFKIDREGVLKVFDFGLAKDIENAKTKGFKGTMVFAAPELFFDQTLEFDEKIDVYAFGVTCAYFALGEKEFFKRLIKIKQPPYYELAYRFEESPQFKASPGVCKKLNACLERKPENRPSMKSIYLSIKKQLLYSSHRGTLVHNETIHILEKPGKRVRIKLGEIGEVIMHYDGYDFYAEEPTGEVFINAKHITTKTKVPSSCVITIGEAHRKSQRLFIPFDCANPEVNL